MVNAAVINGVIVALRQVMNSAVTAKNCKGNEEALACSVPVVHFYHAMHDWNLSGLQLKHGHIANFDRVVRIQPQEQQVASEERRFHASTEITVR